MWQQWNDLHRNIAKGKMMSVLRKQYDIENIFKCQAPDVFTDNLDLQYL